jgi:hypothetical protein
MIIRSKLLRSRSAVSCYVTSHVTEQTATLMVRENVTLQSLRRVAGHVTEQAATDTPRGKLLHDWSCYAVSCKGRATESALVVTLRSQLMRDLTKLYVTGHVAGYAATVTSHRGSSRESAAVM